jgi:alpha-L-fucosidase
MTGMDHPWEENRGMGYSYGYNRAERISDYRTGRELVLMLVDLVSRGGNLLLDIGPDAHGEIPVIMEERLLQIGDWIRVNGEAIYGTKPWKTTRQWTSGELPKIEYNRQYEANYDVAQLAGKPEPGKAAIQAFFTSKGGDLFVILPRWPGRTFLLNDVTDAKSVTLLGSTAALKFKAAKGGVSVQLPNIPEALMEQPAWTLKVSR